ncbi:MAG: PTS sugar transporter subunit IIA [Desulfovibrionaceae bacterium]|jgi:PTS system nitrogen regulatory IIA component
MKLAEYLEQDLIAPDLKAANKSEALTELIELVKLKHPELDSEEAFRVLMEREQLGTTGIGDGVAIPHGKLKSLERIVVVCGRSLSGVEFEALDHSPCAIFFLVLAPEQSAGLHLRLLALISRLLKNPEFRESFAEAEDRDGLWRLLKES